jgi:hypothetical protein
MYSVGVLDHFTLRVRYLSLLNTICNLLGYTRHHSIWYTSFFMTPLVVTTLFVLQCVVTLWCRVSERSFDLFCHLFGDLSSVSLSRCLFYLCLYLGVSSMSGLSLSASLLSLPVSFLCVCRPSNLEFAPGVEDTFPPPPGGTPRCSGFPTIWLLRNS